MTGPGPLKGGMKSSPAGRAGIQAVSLFGPKFGTVAVCPAGPAASAGQKAAMPHRSAARRGRLIASLRVFNDEGSDIRCLRARHSRKYPTLDGAKTRGLRPPHPSAALQIPVTLSAAM